MDLGIIKIMLYILFVSIFIYFIKYNKGIVEYIKNKKIIKIILNIIMIIIMIAVVPYVYKNIVVIKRNFSLYSFKKESEKMYKEYDKKISDEWKFYNEAINKEYNNQNSYMPYIPDGFSYVEGEWNNGFVIQDQNQNQYVWVPCTNLENTDIEKLQRKNFATNVFISKDYCSNDEYKNFITSALENGGFYISRFEIGKENELPVSKFGAEVWTSITRNEALDIIGNMYESNDNINCKLMNGYAYDTTLSWITKNNQVETAKISFGEDKVIYSGTQVYNNIYDFTDSIMELTLETNYETVIIRGFPIIKDQITENLISNSGYSLENFDRFSVREEDTWFSDTTLVAFRTVLYK